MSVSIEVVVPTKTTVGEGPHWEDETQTLIFIDIHGETQKGGELFRWNSTTGELQRIYFDNAVTVAVPCKKGGYLIGLGRTVSHLDSFESQKIKKLHEVENVGTKSRMNDGKCDAVGRFWIGSMGHVAPTLPIEIEKEKGALFSLDIDGTFTSHLDKIGISNGLAWSEDRKTMYYIDTIPKLVYKFNYNIDTGKIDNQTILSDFNKFENSEEIGGPDGMAIDTDGNLWIACYGGGRVVCIDSNTGKLIRTVLMPAHRITSCCFGGKNYDEMYVTSALEFSDEEERQKFPQSGSVFRVTGLGVKGYKANVYEGPITV